MPRTGAIALCLLAFACRTTDRPAPIVYDREPCAHCRMLISEPRFAAQLETAHGEIRSFDDPGCLLAELDAASNARRVWFHHVREDRWLDGADVAFEEVAETPMGYGLGAVDAHTPGAIPLESARTRVRARGEQQQGPR
jgi:copper chaperone NosL